MLIEKLAGWEISFPTILMPLNVTQNISIDLSHQNGDLDTHQSQKILLVDHNS